MRDCQLHPARIKLGKGVRGRRGEPPATQAFRALMAWLQRALSQERLAKCDVETLASTILSAARMGVDGTSLRTLDRSRG